MWISSGGGINTVAIPDPTDVMTDDFAENCRIVWRKAKRRVRSNWLDRLEEKVLIEAANCEVLSVESDYFGAAPPREILSGTPRSLGDIARSVHAVEQRWQVDVVMALMDYLIRSKYRPAVLA